MRKKDKTAITWYLGLGVFALLGIACFVVGYGLKDGWEAVLAWFTSKWAMWVYVFGALYIVILIGYVLWKKDKDALDGK